METTYTKRIIQTMADKPKLSIIIPTKNEAKLLPACLASITGQKTTFSYEVIIVDGNSTDGTQTIARTFGARVITESKKGKIYAFRKGADVAKGEILCFTEGDCVVPPHWLHVIGSYLDTHTHVAAVCGTYSYHDSTWFYKTLTMLGHAIGHALHYAYYGHHSVRASNFAVRANIYRQSGGFSLNLMEQYDTELSHRIKNFGPIRLLSQMRVLTSDRRIRGRLLAYIGELIPAVWSVVARKPITKQTYADIR